MTRVIDRLDGVWRSDEFLCTKIVRTDEHTEQYDIVCQSDICDWLQVRIKNDIIY